MEESKTQVHAFSQDHYNRLTTGDKEQFKYLDNMMRKGNMSEHYVTLCKQFVNKYVAIVTVETPVDVIAVTSRDLSATLFERMGILGGEIGLFTGFSIVSILDWLTAIYNMIQPEDEKKRQNGQSGDINVSDKRRIHRLERIADQQGNMFHCLENKLDREMEDLKEEMKTLRKVCK